MCSRRFFLSFTWGALTCLAFTIFLLDLGRERPAWRAFVTAPLCFITTFPFYLFSTKPSLTHATVFSTLPTKLIVMAGIFFDGNLVLAIGCALLVLAVRHLPLPSRRFLRCRVGPGDIAGLWLAGVLAPTTQEVSAGIDSRIFWYAALISVAALQMPVIETLRLGSGIIALVTLFLALSCARRLVHSQVSIATSVS